MFFYLVICVSTIILYVVLRKRSNLSLAGEHCLVTGGSSGIGLAIAVEAAKLGANVTIVARSQARLEEAKLKIISAAKNSDQKVLTFSVDISDLSSDIGKVVQDAERANGDITFVINCAGTSICKRFEDTTDQDFMSMLNVNFLGSMRVTKAVLPFMKERKKGRVVFVSSLAGVIGLYGYAAYSASKFALVGAAEALQMEVKQHNISVTVSLPPDTDTPGYAEEIKSKLVETASICDNGGFFSAQAVAVKTLSDALKGRFFSSTGFEGWMLSSLCSGTTPVTSYLDLLTQILTMGPIRLAIFIYLKQCDATISKCSAATNGKEQEVKGKLS